MDTILAVLRKVATLLLMLATLMRMSGLAITQLHLIDLIILMYLGRISDLAALLTFLLESPSL